jgi:ketosteroid isomerase-like protein
VQGTSLFARTFAAIQAASDSLSSAVDRRDWNAAAAMYSADGLIFAPGSLPIRGHQAIAAFWQAGRGKGLRTMQLQTIDVDGDANEIIELGKYTLRGEGDATLDVGKYLVVWRRSGRGWRIARDVSDSSLETRSPLDAPDCLTAPVRPPARDE